MTSPFASPHFSLASSVLLGLALALEVGVSEISETGSDDKECVDTDA